MLKNYFQIAVRTLIRYRFYTVISVLGLALSTSICMLLMLIVRDQRSLDRGHLASERLFRVTSEITFQENADAQGWATSPVDLGPVLKESGTGIDAYLRLSGLHTWVRTEEASGTQAAGFFAEPSYFRLLDFDLVAGREMDALSQPNTAVLSEAIARTLFGNRDPLGQTVQLDGIGACIVSGVLKDSPIKSNFKADVLVSFSTLSTLPGRKAELVDWKQNLMGYFTYLMVTPGTSKEQIQASVDRLLKSKYGGGRSQIQSFKLQPVRDISTSGRLRGDHAASVVDASLFFMIGMALLVMLVAGFNYVGLNIARALRRAREVGVRKVLGAGRGQIVSQLLIEAVLVSLAASVIAWCLLLWLKPAFNQLSFVRRSQLYITNDIVSDPILYIVFLLFTVFVGMAAGLYPGLYLSRMESAVVLKGVLKGLSGRRLRNVFIGLQFGVALVLMSVTLLLYRQFDHMMRADYGFDQDQMVIVDMKDMPADRLRDALAGSPYVQGVSFSTSIPVVEGGEWTMLSYEDGSRTTQARSLGIDEAFLSNWKIRLMAGRTFEAGRGTDSTSAIILNGVAARFFGYDDPQRAIGQLVGVGTDGTPAEVIGVTDDFHVDEMADGVKPTVLRYAGDGVHYANIRFGPGARTDGMRFLEQTWKRLAPGREFSYEFLDRQIDAQYVVYRDLMRVIGLVAIFALIIAALGLLGMATYSMELRRKEVGIRKVFGASERSLVYTLSSDMLKLVLIAGVVAAPIAYLINSLWIENFAYRVQVDAWTILGSLLLLVLIAGLTVSTQTLRAARMNPADVVRYE